MATRWWIDVCVKTMYPQPIHHSLKSGIYIRAALVVPKWHWNKAYHSVWIFYLHKYIISHTETGMPPLWYQVEIWNQVTMVDDVLMTFSYNFHFHFWTVCRVLLLFFKKRAVRYLALAGDKDYRQIPEHCTIYVTREQMICLLAIYEYITKENFAVNWNKIYWS